MRRVLFFVFCVAFEALGTTALLRGLDLDNTDGAVRGGASHECYRECVANDTRVCYYEFVAIEWLTMTIQCKDCPYKSEDCYSRGCLTAGGDVRVVNVVNNMLPGPSIQVCKGDIVQVNLTNTHPSEGVSIHWHGLSQIGTPYMDGVPFVTQCPIEPGSTFLYNFTADPAGTHMWHSHVGFQEADGFHGSLIIREADDVNADYYDYDLPEHVMTVWHWFGTDSTTALKSTGMRGLPPTVYTVIINGLARTLKYTQDDEDYYTPMANFTVTQGSRYRFRIVNNAIVYCPLQISVDNHTLTMIASDGATFEPIEVESFMVNAGERYDFVLTANQEIRNYWIRYRGIGNCRTDVTFLSTVAILHYDGAGDEDPPEATDYDDANRSGVLLNSVQESDETYTDYLNNTFIRIVDLNSTMKTAQDVSGTPDVTFYIPLTLTTFADQLTSNQFQTPCSIHLNLNWVWDSLNCLPLVPKPANLYVLASRSCTLKTIPMRKMKFTGSPQQFASETPLEQLNKQKYQFPGPFAQFNNVSFRSPPVPFLTQYDDITPDMYCTQNDYSSLDCSNDYCTCPMVYEMKKDILAEIFIIDQSQFFIDHPLHFHGHYVRVVAAQTGTLEYFTVDEVKTMNENGLIEKKLDNAPLKDVISVPSRGFIAFRMITNNPGYWLLHCHVGNHLDDGMEIVLKVGEHSEMAQAPANFPTCSGSYDITKSS